VLGLGVSKPNLFDSCVEEIEAAYSSLDYKLGWRFLSVSKSVLNSPVRVAFVTLNPGGNRIPPDHSTASCENGASYLVERWTGNSPGQAPLQVQVQRLFEALRVPLSFHGTNEQLMAESLIGHFIPFRSPRFADLPRRDEALEIGRRLWERLFQQTSPRLVICLGREVQRELRQLMPRAMNGKPFTTQSYQTGWGGYQVDIDAFETRAGTARLMYLPHLSTFKIFTSDRCRVPMRVALAAAARGL